MSIALIIAILIAHYVSDFTWQRDYYRLNKSKNLFVCALHGLIYSVCFFWVLVAFQIIYYYLSGGNIFVGYEYKCFGVAFLAITSTTHFIVDAITSRITASLWEKEKYHQFFDIIGLDQLCHYIILFLTFALLKGN